VVIHDLHVERIAILEAETYTPLVVHTDAPLPCAIMLQGFQPVRGRQAQILDTVSGVQLREPRPSSRQTGRPLQR